MEIDTDINFETVCRVCLKTSPNLGDIFGGKVVEMLKDIAPISISQADGLPQQLCDQCIYDITRCYSFRMLIIQTDANLREILNNRSYKTNDCLSENAVYFKEEVREEPGMATDLQKCDSMFIGKTELSNMPEFKQHVKICSQADLQENLTDTDDDDFSDFAPDVKDEEMEKQLSTPADLVKGDTEFVCKMCKKALNNMAALKRHMKTHSDIKNYNCSECSRAFRTQTQLRNHMKTHSGERPYTCDVCNKSFPYVASLDTHKKIHLGIKSFVCPECNKSFTQKGNLRSHIQRKHTQERPYLCTDCGKTYVTKVELENHMREHTGEKKPLQFVCPFCSKRFVTAGELKIHCRIHTDERPYECDLCGKKLRTSSHMASHKRSHTGEKKHVCQFCEKAFKESCILKIHVRTHTGEKPYSCQVCDMGFTQKSQLTTHMKVHNNDKD